MDAETQIESWRSLWLSWPDAWEDHPWGETVFKVGKKIFVFLGEDETPAVTFRPPDEDLEEALALPGTRPSSYIGRYGWVTAELTEASVFPLLDEWIACSYDRAGGKTRARARRALEPD